MNHYKSINPFIKEFTPRQIKDDPHHVTQVTNFLLSSLMRVIESLHP